MAIKKRYGRRIVGNGTSGIIIFEEDKPTAADILNRLFACSLGDQTEDFDDLQKQLSTFPEQEVIDAKKAMIDRAEAISSGRL